MCRHWLGYAGSLYCQLGHREVARSEHHEPGKPGSRFGEALSLDGTAPLRLVLSGPGYFGTLRKRGVPFHDNVGADNETLVRDKRGDATVLESEQGSVGADTAAGGDLRAGTDRTQRGSGC